MGTTAFNTSPSPGTVHCVICGQLSTRLLTKFSIDMHRCPECQVVFTYPVPPSEVVESRYNQSWFETEFLPSFGINPHSPSLVHLAARFESELAPLEKFKTKIPRLLDVGAGAGLFLSEAKNKGWNTYGVELSEFGSRYAKQHFGIEVVQGLLHDAHYESGFFDVVMLQDTIEHVPDPKAVLLEVSRILRRGGALVMSTPNINSLGKRIIGDAWALISPQEHLCLFNPRSLRVLYESTGFSVEKLITTRSVSSDLIHEAGRPENRQRKTRLEKIKNFLPGPLISFFELGDELHSIGVKQ